MGLLDEFITNISAVKEEEVKEGEVKEKESEGRGGFDNDYAKSFLDYCRNGGR